MKRALVVIVVVAAACVLGSVIGGTRASAQQAGSRTLKLVYKGSGFVQVRQHIDNITGHEGSAYDDTYSKRVKWSIAWEVTIEDERVLVGKPTGTVSGTATADKNSGYGLGSCSGPVRLPVASGKPYIPTSFVIVDRTRQFLTIRLDGFPVAWAASPSCLGAEFITGYVTSPSGPAGSAWGKSWGAPEFKIALFNNYKISPASIGNTYPFPVALPIKKIVFDWNARLTIAEASAPPPTSPTTTAPAPSPGKPPGNKKKKAKKQRFLFPGNSLDKLEQATRTIQLGGGGEQTVPVEDEHWPDPGTLLDEVCIVPDPKNPTGPCPKARDLAAGSLAVAPAPSARSAGKLPLRVTLRGASALRAGGPLTVLLRVTFKPAVGPPVTATRPLTFTPRGAGPAIASVTFGGSQQAPTITIRGKNLGTKPAPNPTGSPSNRPPLCPVTIQGNAGLDYGTSLYIADDARRLAAGRYRPSISELDCIGLIVTKFTPTEVDYRFGAYYAQVYPQYPLTQGDAVRVAVNGATKTVHVQYGATVTG